MAVKVPPAKKPKLSTYRGFLGVDYSVEAGSVGGSRAADMLNMISDTAGLPEKRLGYTTLYHKEGSVNGIFYGHINDQEIFIAHIGSNLYKFTDYTIEGSESIELIGENLADNRSKAFFMEHKGDTKIFILTGEDYLVYDGSSLQPVSDIATIPLVVISKNPDGTGGVSYKGINLITPYRREGFLSDGSSKIYQLSAKDIDSSSVTVEITTTSGVVSWSEGVNFTVDRSLGQVKFNTAPSAPIVSGQDNVEICYSKTVENYSQRIKNSTTFAYYGIGGDNRVFLTGNSQYKAWDFWCEIDDPTYFPDINYGIIGSENTGVMGYAKLGEYLLIIKEDNQQDSTIFVRTGELLDDGAIFPIKQGVTGVGAIAGNTFVNLVDEPLFLSSMGVYAITSNLVTAERTLQNRSYYIDPKLTKEASLHRAIACQWNSYYLLAINSRVYLLDSRQKTGSGNSYQYEGYLWQGLDINALLSHKGNLYFGGSDGGICKLNTHIDNMTKYRDNGQAITAYWDTPADDDGNVALLKTMERKGGLLLIKPSYKTGANIYVSVDGEPFELIRSGSFSIFGWENIDFTRFTFLTTSTPKRIYFNHKIRKYTTLQFRIENSSLDESLGIYEITKYFTTYNYGKG